MTVIFQSHHQLDFCDRILRSLEEDDGDSLVVATSSPELSLASLKLLQLFSPLVREIVKTLPSMPSAASPLTLILPDTDANSWKCLMGLLTSGNVDVCLPSCDTDVERQKEKISALARCLQINLESRQVSEKARIKLRVKRPEELLEDRSTSPIASNQAQENNIVSNDYDSDQENVPEPSKSDGSDPDYRESSAGFSSALSFNIVPNESDQNNGIERLVESQKDASYSSRLEEVLIDIPDMTEEPVLKMKRKVILTWKKKDTMTGTIKYSEIFSDSINYQAKRKEEILPNALSGADELSSGGSNREGDINYFPKDVKVTYATWKARRAARKELRLKQKVAEGSVTVPEIENNQKKGPEKVHEFECSNCSKRFKSEAGLSDHFNASHTKPVDSAECPRCWRVFKTKEHLFVHFHATHTKNQNPFTCFDCPKSSRLRFSSRTALLKHLKIVHSLKITKDWFVNSAIYEYETEVETGSM